MAGKAPANNGITIWEDTDALNAFNGGNGMDELKGLDGNDNLYGDNGDDKLWGNEGVDTLYGDNGEDTLTGGTGNDVLTGGRGSDTFSYSVGDGRDTITDFVTGVDIYDTDFSTTADNYNIQTSAADNTQWLHLNTDTNGIFEIEGSFGTLDFTNNNAVANAIASNGVIVVDGYEDNFMLILHDTETNNSYLYQCDNNVIADGYYWVPGDNDYMELVGVFENANLATGDIV